MLQQIMGQSQIVAIIISNIILVMAAVWRLSASLQKVETQLVGMNDKMEIVNKYHDQELATIKSQLATFSDMLKDTQTRITTLELEARLQSK